jgi:hypothetical protein
MLVRNWFCRSGAVEGSGGSEAASAPVEQSGPVVEDIESILRFDPFEASTTEEAAAPPPVVVEPGQATVGDTVTGAAVTETPIVATPAPTDALASTVEALRTTVEGLPAAITAATKPPEPAAPQADEWAPTDGTDKLNYVQIMDSMPDALINQLGSENPVERKQAVSQLMGVAMHVAHRLAAKQAVTQMRAELQQVLPAFVSEQMQAHATSQRVFSDFYGKFPMLNVPELRPMVRAAATELMQETKAAGWNEQFRDALGARILQKLRGFQGAPVAPPSAPPAQMTGPSARPGLTTRGTTTTQQDIADLLF